MPRFAKSTEVDKYPTVVIHGKDGDLTCWIHPKGPHVSDPVGMAFQGETVQRVMRTLESLQRKRDAGTIDDRTYQLRYAELSKLRDEEKLTRNQFDDLADSLLSQRDGTPVTVEEFGLLNVQIDQWRRAASFGTTLREYIKGTVFRWDYYADEQTMKDGGDPLPVSDETMDAHPEDFNESNLMAIFVKVQDYYKLQDDEGKKSEGSSLEPLPQMSEVPGSSPNSTSASVPTAQ